MSMIPFDFESKSVRVLTDDHGEPLFVAKDVAEALGYKDPTTAVKTHCRGVQELHPIVDSLGRTQEARVISFWLERTLPADCSKRATS